jgi:hypothetical protein
MPQGQILNNQEIIFAGSRAIVLFLMVKLLQELSPAARHALLGTAITSSSCSDPFRTGGRSDVVGDRCFGL